jgi:hypothetical protein
MRNLPIVFPRVCGEKTIVDSISNLLESSGDGLCEPLLVADLVHQLMGRDEYSVATAKVELEDRACPGSVSARHSRIPEDIPYISASRVRLADESAGSMSLILPKIGRPGGPGMGSGMVI